MNVYRKHPAEEISLDELRERIAQEDESSLLEYRLGLYCEMDTESIGVKADLSRLFKQGLFTEREKKVPVKKLADLPLGKNEKYAFHRALVKLRNFYLN